MTQGQSLTRHGWDGVTRNFRPGWCRCCCFGADLFFFGAGVTTNGAGAAVLAQVSW